MYIKNDTDQKVGYTIEGGGAIDCGAIAPHEVASFPQYDKGYERLALNPLDPAGYLELKNGPPNAVVTLSLTVASIDDKAKR